MRTYLLENNAGNIYAFEISNAFISSQGIARFFKRCNDCKVTKIRRMFSREEVHLCFTFQSNEFVVWEPYGDNSRLHISFLDDDKHDPILVKRLADIVSKTPRFGRLLAIDEGR